MNKKILLWAAGIFFFGLITTKLGLGALSFNQLSRLHVLEEKKEEQIAETKAESRKLEILLADKRGELNTLREERQEIVEARNHIINSKSSGIANFEPSGGGIDEFLQLNGAEFVKEAGDTFRAVGELYKIKPEVLVCIAQADSSLGRNLRTSNNVGNIGNTESASRHYATLEAAIEAMGQTLNNQYLGSYTTIGELSRGGGNADGKVYATSLYNWNLNVKTCLQDILQDNSINESFTFRLK